MLSHDQVEISNNNTQATTEIQDIRKIRAEAYKKQKIQNLISDFKDNLFEASKQSKRIEVESYKYFESKQSLANFKSNPDYIPILEKLIEDTAQIVSNLETLHKLAAELKENEAISEEDFNGLIKMLDDYQAKLDKCRISLRWVLENLSGKDLLPFWDEFRLCENDEQQSYQGVLLSYPSHLKIALDKIYNSIENGNDKHVNLQFPFLRTPLSVESKTLPFWDILHIANQSSNLNDKLAMVQINKDAYELKSSLSYSSSEYIKMFLHMDDSKIRALREKYNQDFIHNKSEINTAEEILCHLLLTNNIDSITLDQIEKISPLNSTDFNPPLTETEKNTLDPIVKTIVAAIKCNTDQYERYKDDGLYKLLENFPRDLLGKLNFRGAKLDNMSFGDKVSLRGVDCKGASFISSSFSSVDLSEANFENCNFSNAYFSSANLTKANCRAAKFINARLIHARALAANMELTDFTNAQIEQGCFIGVNFAHANMSSAQMPYTNFYFSNFESTNFTENKFLLNVWAPSHSGIPHFKFCNIYQAQGISNNTLVSINQSKSFLTGNYLFISNLNEFYKFQDEISLSLENFNFSSWHFESELMLGIINPFISKYGFRELEVLLKNSPKFKVEENISNPFHLAIELNKPEHFKILMQNTDLRKALSLKNEDGLTPLMLAEKLGAADIICLLDVPKVSNNTNDGQNKAIHSEKKEELAHQEFKDQKNSSSDKATKLSLDTPANDNEIREAPLLPVPATQHQNNSDFSGQKEKEIASTIIEVTSSKESASNIMSKKKVAGIIGACMLAGAFYGASLASTVATYISPSFAIPVIGQFIGVGALGLIAAATIIGAVVGGTVGSIAAYKEYQNSKTTTTVFKENSVANLNRDPNYLATPALT